MSEQRLRRSIDPGLFDLAGIVSSLRAFGRWFGDALAYAMGRPAELATAAPPLLGVQPFHGVIESRRGRHRH